MQIFVLNKNYIFFLFFITILFLIGIQVLACFNELAEVKKELLANKVLIKTLKNEVEILTAVKIALISPKVIAPKVTSYSLGLIHYVTVGITFSVLTYALYVFFSTTGSGNIPNISGSLNKFDNASAAESDFDPTLSFVLDIKTATETSQKIAENSCSDAFKGKFNTLRGCEPPEFIKPKLSGSFSSSETVSVFLGDLSHIASTWIEFFTFW